MSALLSGDWKRCTSEARLEKLVCLRPELEACSMTGLACAAVLAAWVGLPSIATAGEWLRANMTTSSTHVSTPDSTEHGAYYYEPLPNEDTAPTLPADYWGPPRVPAQPAVSTRSHPANL